MVLQINVLKTYTNGQFFCNLLGTKHNSFSDRRNHMNEFGQVKTKAANKGAALSKRGENGTNY